jgi:paraquat-inducible protein A
MNPPRQLHPGASAEAAGGSESLGRNAGQVLASHDSDSYNQPLAEASLIACPDCDLLQRLPEVALGGSARCPRCDKELWRRPEDSLNRTLALTLGAALLYVVANTVPMLGLTAVGHQSFTTVVGGAQQLWRNDQEIVAALVLFAAVIAPALQIGMMLLILIGALREHPSAWVGTLLRHHPMTRTWSMLEVMLLGVLVALTKIADYATVIPGLALFAVGALVFVLPAMQSSFDPREVWDRIDWAEAAARRPAAGNTKAEATS